MRLRYLLILLLTFSCATTPVPRYERQSWRYPTDEDGDCQNTRAEVLVARSKVPVRFKGKKTCVVVSGLWDDFYYPEEIRDARKAHIDHLVSLKEAHDAGGHAWGPEQKRRFANDPENLVITSSKTNQQKGSKSFTTWVPVHQSYACRYLAGWKHVMAKYQLPVSAQLARALRANHCPASGSSRN